MQLLKNFADGNSGIIKRTYVKTKKRQSFNRLPFSCS